MTAVVLVAPTPAMSVTPADPAVAAVAPPPIAADPESGPAPEPGPTPDPGTELDLQTEVDQAPSPNDAEAMLDAATAAVPDGVSAGVAVLDLQTGALAAGGTTQFFSASLSKLMLVVDMLDRDVPLSDTDRGWIVRALAVSDDNAMNALWTKFDGYNAMTRVAESLDMAGTKTTDDRSQWGEVIVTPAGFARLYQHIMEEMADDDKAIIVSALGASEPRAADGFDQYFGLLGGPVKAFAKQGWMYYGSKLYLHSAGVVTNGADNYVVVLMSAQQASTGPARANLSSIAQAVQSAMPSPMSAEARAQEMK
ncbi:MAG: serine hydrolase [Kibdelosporangium sp.]